MELKNSVILTGDRPSGPLHLGHYVGSLEQRLALQGKAPMFIVIADLQALTDHAQNPAHVHENVLEITKDYLSVGLNPTETTFFIQSQIPQLWELMGYFMNLVTVARVGRNPTLKHEIQQKNMQEHLPLGFFCYPISQAADIAAFSYGVERIVVPVGDDQIPMIEQTNEIVRKFNATYTCATLKECHALVGSVGRLVGIDGQHKASKSLGNAIALSDPLEKVKEKIWAMYTDPTHIQVQDPGKVEGHVVFAYLDAFYNNREHLQELKAHYRKGGLGDVFLKDLLWKTLEAFLTPIQDRRKALHHDEIWHILHEGTRKTRDHIACTMEQVRRDIGLIYHSK